MRTILFRNQRPNVLGPFTMRTGDRIYLWNGKGGVNAQTLPIPFALKLLHNSKVCTQATLSVHTTCHSDPESDSESDSKPGSDWDLNFPVFGHKKSRNEIFESPKERETLYKLFHAISHEKLCIIFHLSRNKIKSNNKTFNWSPI